MKKLCGFVFCLLLVGCSSSNASREKVLRVALADTNMVLTEAQERAASYQKAYERLVHEKVKEIRRTRKKHK